MFEFSTFPPIFNFSQGSFRPGVLRCILLRKICENFLADEVISRSWAQASAALSYRDTCQAQASAALRYRAPCQGRASLIHVRLCIAGSALSHAPGARGSTCQHQPRQPHSTRSARYTGTALCYLATCALQPATLQPPTLQPTALEPATLQLATLQSSAFQQCCLATCYLATCYLATLPYRMPTFPSRYG